MKKLKSLLGGDKRRDSANLDFDEQFRKASESEMLRRQSHVPEVYSESPRPSKKSSSARKDSIHPQRIVDCVEVVKSGIPQQYLCTSSAVDEPSCATMILDRKKKPKAVPTPEVQEIVKEKQRQKEERLQRELAALSESYAWSKPGVKQEAANSNRPQQVATSQPIQANVQMVTAVSQPIHAMAQPIQAVSQPVQVQTVQAQPVQTYQPVQACQPDYSQPICVAAQSVQMIAPCKAEAYVPKAKQVPAPIKSNPNSGLDILDDI